jgi:hypothetical protein
VTVFDFARYPYLVLLLAVVLLFVWWSVDDAG